jgi:hypothetical protein
MFDGVTKSVRYLFPWHVLLMITRTTATPLLQVEKLPVCEPVTSTKCDEVTFTRCEEVRRTEINSFYKVAGYI